MGKISKLNESFKVIESATQTIISDIQKKHPEVTSVWDRETSKGDINAFDLYKDGELLGKLVSSDDAYGKLDDLSWRSPMGGGFGAEVDHGRKEKQAVRKLVSGILKEIK